MRAKPPARACAKTESRRMTLFKRAFVLALTAYLGLCALMYLFQRQLQYFPTQRNPAPQDLGLTGVARLHLPTPDGETLVIWHSPAAAGHPTILFFQGNAGEIADRAGRFAFWQTQGYGVVFVSPRGYGGSTGHITERGLVTDAVAAFDWLMAQGTLPRQVVLIGESLGTGLAVQLAAQRSVGAVVLEAPYSATADVAARLYPWLPVRLLMQDQYRSIDHISRINAPLLILHGTDDRVIPFDLGQRLFDAAKDPKTFVPLPGQGHDALFTPALWQTEARLLQDLFPG
jgi:uncharacterized protein